MLRQPLAPTLFTPPILSQNSDTIENPFAEYTNDRDMNLVKMILNLTHNNSNDYQKPTDVYNTYSQMAELDYDENVRKSIENSKSVMQIPFKRHVMLTKLIENDSKSFLALPLLGKGHLGSTLIRKTDEGYSALVINKGMRFWHDPVEEFVFSKNNPNHISNLEKCLSYAGSFGMKNIEDVYRKFIEHSDAQYNMKINAGPQKVGNCFTKNIQAAIKIAQGTLDIPVEEFRKFRMSTPYTSFGTEQKDRVTFKWKDIETEKMQVLFVNKIAEKNPAIRVNVDEAINIYKFNKHLRENFKQGMEPTKALETAFENNSEIEGLDTLEQHKIMLKNITPYNLANYQDKISEIVNSTKNAQYISDYKDLLEFSKLGTYMGRSIYMMIFMEARHEPLKSLYRVYDRSNTFDKLADDERLREVLKNIDVYTMKRYESEIKSACEQVYGKENGNIEYKNAYDFATQKMQNIQNNWQNNIDKIKALSKQFPLVADSIREEITHSMLNTAKYLLYDRNNPSDSMKFIDRALELKENYKSFYLKGLCLAAINNPFRALENFTKALKNNPTYTTAMLARGNMFMALNDKTSANKDFDNAKRIYPNARIPAKADRFLQIPFTKNNKNEKNRQDRQLAM